MSKNAAAGEFHHNWVETSHEWNDGKMEPKALLGQLDPANDDTANVNANKTRPERLFCETDICNAESFQHSAAI